MAPIKNISRGFIGSFISKIGVSTSIFNRPNLSPTKLVSSAYNVTAPGNGYIYHTFITPGRFYVFNSGYVDFCVVAGGGAGGGGGGTTAGGGGGAGGFVERYNVLCTVGFYDVCIGIGGAPATTPTAVGPRNGTPSFITGPVGFTSITAAGGGAGGSSPGNSGQPGGSGGGGATPGGSSGSGTGSGINREGYPGGNAGGGSPGTGGASGGGASSAGKPVNVDSGVSGANGLAAFNGDTGVPSIVGTVGPTPGRFFSGGGGSSPSTSGGIGGGGAGGPSVSAGSDALLTTGGGGGGTVGPNQNGGAGGSGTVIIRYKSKKLPF